jgi:hypothetical protein
MTQIPNTNTAVSYAYTIKANGVPIGTLQGFTPSQNRTLERVREIMNEITDIVEIIPGRGEISLTIDRFETYSQSLFTALGYTTFPEDLSSITFPIQIIEVLTGPVSAGSPRRQITYQDCWIQSLGKSIKEGTLTVNSNATLWVTKIIATNS